MVNKNIAVLTDDYYFYCGVCAVLENNPMYLGGEFCIKQVQHGGENISIAEHAIIWVIDIDGFCHDITRYFEIMDTMVNIKIKYGDCCQVILCYNKFVCLPSSLCYKLFSVINTANSFSALNRDFYAAIEPSPWYQRSYRAPEKMEQQVLTRAEYQVLKALSRGENVKRVAYHYQRSPKTISHHKCSGLNKMKRKRLSSLYC